MLSLGMLICVAMLGLVQVLETNILQSFKYIHVYSYVYMLILLQHGNKFCQSMQKLM